MTTINRRITKIISERRLPEITTTLLTEDGFTTPFEIYGSQEVIKTLFDPGHWEKKCWMTLYTKKFLLPTDYGANGENTLIISVRQQSPMKPAPIKISKRRASFNCFGLQGACCRVSEGV